MVWFKVDDGFYTSQKVLSIPRAQRLPAVGLWTMAGNWSGRELSDGVVPAYVLAELGATPKLCQALVTARLWVDRGSGGYEFHDWAKYQPTRERVLADRARAAERQAKRRSSHEESQGSHGVTTGELHPESRRESHDPDPTRPDPTNTTTANAVVERPAKRGSRLSTDWLPSAESVAVVKKDAPDVDAKAEHPTFVDYWIAQPGQKGVKTNWDATWRNWMRRKQGDIRKSTAPKQTAAQRNLSTVEFFATQQEQKAVEQ